MQRLAMTITMIAVATGSTAYSQVVREMTPERVKEAIAWGMAQKNVEFPEIMSGTGWAWKSEKPLWGMYSTPYLRVAAAANSAKKRYKSFTEAEVTPQMISPELHVYGFAVPLGGTSIANVEAIVITKHKEKDRAKAIQPIRSEPLPAEYQNLFGAKAEGRSMLAVFPLEVLQKGNEVHVVYDQKMSVGNLLGCDDCSVELKVDKLR